MLITHQVNMQTPTVFENYHIIITAKSKFLKILSCRQKMYIDQFEINLLPEFCAKITLIGV